MSTAVETVAKQSAKVDMALTEPVPRADETDLDPHPLLPVFIAGLFSLVLAITLVGAVLAGLALRHSGIMAP